MKTYISRQEKLHVIGTWDGEESGEILDWAQDNGYVTVVQTEDLESAQERALAEVNAGASAAMIEPRKMLVVLGKALYSQVTVDSGGILALREDVNGKLVLMDVSPEYLDKYYRESVE